MWKAWKSFPEVTKSFSRTCHAPFEEITIESRRFQVIERYATQVNNIMTTSCVNELRPDMFTSKVPLMENLPPTKEALLQHTKRSHFQASIWSKCLQTVQNVPSPDTHGWKLCNDKWIPRWSNSMEASKVCKELLQCHCKALYCIPYIFRVVFLRLPSTICWQFFQGELARFRSIAVYQSSAPAAPVRNRVNALADSFKRFLNREIGIILGDFLFGQSYMFLQHCVEL